MSQRLELNDDEVHVWGVVPQAVDDAGLLRRYEDVLSADEQAQRRRLRLDRLRHDYLVAHTLVRVSLSRYADVSPEDWTFVRNRHGRPDIGGPRGAPPLRFNLSHTGGLVVCAVAMRRAVGVDVEDRSRPLRCMSVAERFFSSVEVDALHALPEAERHSAFFTFWTLKEAYIKARGLGLSMPLEKFSFALDGGEGPAISFAPGLDDDPRRWRFALFRPTQRHVVALAAQREANGVVRARLRLAVPFGGAD
jgi:4'-phosphopantetheinyl transferase